MRASSLRRNAPANPRAAKARSRSPRQIVADRREDLAQHGDPGGELGARPVARFGGGPVQPGEGLGDHGCGGGGGEAGEVVQIGDGGEAERQGGSRRRFIPRAVRDVALRGEVVPVRRAKGGLADIGARQQGGEFGA